MDTSFPILVRFLQQTSDEVQGREAVTPDAETINRFEAFARGSCSDSERAAICLMIKDSPQWVSYLAESVKRLRSGSAAPGA
jgi:hypothetical protein